MQEAPNSVAADEIHVWLTCDPAIDDPDLLRRYEGLLSEAERARCARFHFARHRHQFLVAHALVRSVLSRYRGEVEARHWEFGTNEYGKPFVCMPGLSRPPGFNLSHTDGMIALAVTAGREVGVDVETVSRTVDVEGIGPRYFAPEEMQDLWCLSPERWRERFFSLWTLKEAYIKACGMGLSIPLNHFAFRFEEGRIGIRFVPARQDEPDAWRFWQFAPGAEHLVAVAIKDPEAGRLYRLRVFRGSPLGDWRAMEA